MAHAPGPRNAAEAAKLAREAEAVDGPRKRQASVRVAEPTSALVEPAIGKLY
eukprot:CAMPEP_0119088794 /NCGR_PEP_ID=MMETSP1178-20130426/146741_1 /TAXON_ID=33656 /ORGANISM="unid sp, Strain CCMP2000" /LENGTH=51 /DNA_ID=CAMNT_0007072103 /DNA_START=47 /DNA_END=202 /DNA_ORIENTATION=+